MEYIQKHMDKDTTGKMRLQKMGVFVRAESVGGRDEKKID